jgi:chemotaxis regulatin CheY-phosphate phosphatase CheZ
MITSIFVVTTAYYKHGEADSKIFTDIGCLEEYLTEEIRGYGYDSELESSNYDVNDKDERIYALAETAVRLGRAYVDDQIGWGILKITEICIDGVVKEQYDF